jgi:hypothetical protein
MIDERTKEPLRVETAEGGMPYIWLRATQAEAVLQLLAKHGVRHWRSEDNFSVDGGPFMTHIYLGKMGNAKAVQAILDSVP